MLDPGDPTNSTRAGGLRHRSPVPRGDPRGQEARSPPRLTALHPSRFLTGARGPRRANPGRRGAGTNEAWAEGWMMSGSAGRAGLHLTPAVRGRGGPVARPIDRGAVVPCPHPHPPLRGEGDRGVASGPESGASQPRPQRLAGVGSRPVPAAGRPPEVPVGPGGGRRHGPDRTKSPSPRQRGGCGWGLRNRHPWTTSLPACGRPLPAGRGGRCLRRRCRARFPSPRLRRGGVRGGGRQSRWRVRWMAWLSARAARMPAPP